MVFLPKYQNLKWGKHEQTQIIALKCFEISEWTEELFQTDGTYPLLSDVPGRRMHHTLLCFKVHY